MATHSNILAWKIPWTEEPGSPKDCKESDMTELSMHSLESNSRNNKYNNFGHNQDEEKIMSLTRRETDFVLTVKLN